MDGIGPSPAGALVAAPAGPSAAPAGHEVTATAPNAAATAVFAPSASAPAPIARIHGVRQEVADPRPRLDVRVGRAVGGRHRVDDAIDDVVQQGGVVCLAHHAGQRLRPRFRITSLPASRSRPSPSATAASRTVRRAASRRPGAGRSGRSSAPEAPVSKDAAHLARRTTGRGHQRQHLQGGDQAVAGGRVVRQHDVARLLPAKIEAVGAQCAPLRSGRPPWCGEGRGPRLLRWRSSPRLDITVAATPPPAN